MATVYAGQSVLHLGVDPVIRVVVTGSECTGKTTLAEALATHYATVFVPEFARQFVINKGAAPEYEDVMTIARGQIVLENKEVNNGPDLLIQDTDLLSTILYSHHYYGYCFRSIEDTFKTRTADLYLLANIDIPWHPDTGQRDRGDRREAMHELFCHALVTHRLTFKEISGSHSKRLETAVLMIDQMLSHAS